MERNKNTNKMYQIYNPKLDLVIVETYNMREIERQEKNYAKLNEEYGITHVKRTVTTIIEEQ